MLKVDALSQHIAFLSLYRSLSNLTVTNHHDDINQLLQYVYGRVEPLGDGHTLFVSLPHLRQGKDIFTRFEKLDLSDTAVLDRYDRAFFCYYGVYVA